jgi:hypothetical protein
MSYFFIEKENQRFEPQTPGKLLLRVPAYHGHIEVDESIASNNLGTVYGLIVNYLDCKDLCAFYATSKKVQYLLNKNNTCPAAIEYELNRTSSISMWSLRLVSQSLQKVSLRILDLSACSDNIALFKSFSSQCQASMKNLEMVDLSKRDAIVVPHVPGYLSLSHEYHDNRTDTELLQQEKVGGVVAHQLLSSLRSLTSLRKLSLKNQFDSNFRLRDLFRRELKGVEVLL